MLKIALRLLATLAMALVMALSSGVALAGFDYDGDCPPRSAAGETHLSAKGAAITAPITPPAALRAWNAPSK